MKQTLNAKERDAEQWASLVDRANSGLHISSIRSSPAALLSVIEIVFDQTPETSAVYQSY